MSQIPFRKPGTKFHLHPCFCIHKEYIPHEEIDYGEEDDFDDDDDDDPFKRLYLQKEEKPFLYSDYHPFFITKQLLTEIIEKEFPNHLWKGDKEFAIVHTQHAVLHFIIITEGEDIYGPVSVTVMLSDTPFFDLKRLCKKYGWHLYHLNSLSYIDLDKVSEIENDFISGDLDF